MLCVTELFPLHTASCLLNRSLMIPDTSPCKPQASVMLCIPYGLVLVSKSSGFARLNQSPNNRCSHHKTLTGFQSKSYRVLRPPYNDLVNAKPFLPITSIRKLTQFLLYNMPFIAKRPKAAESWLMNGTYYNIQHLITLTNKIQEQRNCRRNLKYPRCVSRWMPEGLMEARK